MRERVHLFYMSIPHDVVKHSSLERRPGDAHGGKRGDMGQPLQQQPRHEEIRVMSDGSFIMMEGRGQQARIDNT